MTPAEFMSELQKIQVRLDKNDQHILALAQRGKAATDAFTELAQRYEALNAVVPPLQEQLVHTAAHAGLESQLNLLGEKVTDLERLHRDGERYEAIEARLLRVEQWQSRHEP